MSTTGREFSAEEARARELLARGVAELKGEPYERRHEVLMEWAETALGLDRAHAEMVYALAEEEDLEPVLALQLVRAGLGVRELEPPEQDMDEAAQQAPPEWVAEDTVELEDVTLERRLRATFRRFRSHMDANRTPASAAVAFLSEPDVGLVRLY